MLAMTIEEEDRIGAESYPSQKCLECNLPTPARELAGNDGKACDDCMDGRRQCEGCATTTGVDAVDGLCVDCWTEAHD